MEIASFVIYYLEYKKGASQAPARRNQSLCVRYERLLNYVTVHTTSDPNSGTHPSTARQFDLARQLVEELKGLA